MACLDTKLDPDLYVALGNKTSWTVAPFLQANSGFFAHISYGDSCDPITSYRSAKFELTCNPNGPLIPSAPRLFEDVPCHYVFQMSSSAFCPISPDDGDDFDPGWIFVIVISSVFLTYLIVGSIIWRFVLRKVGCFFFLLVVVWKCSDSSNQTKKKKNSNQETWIVHQDFWEYVYVCVLDGLALVFCCRKRKLEYQAVL